MYRKEKRKRGTGVFCVWGKKKKKEEGCLCVYIYTMGDSSGTTSSTRDQSPASEQDAQKANVDINSVTRASEPLLAALYALNSEIEAPSEGDAVRVTRDPHLRLRRTFTPASPVQGLMDKECRFIIHGSSGTRVPLFFSWEGNDFQMDAYVWGADEENATHRVLAIHGVMPDAPTRTRFHQLGERLAASSTGVRFVALDWHSIDRRDAPQDAFLTMLPKHFNDPISESFADSVSTTDISQMTMKLAAKAATTPRSLADAASVLRQIITEALGWGGTDNTKFVLGIKSWSGGVVMTMLAELARTGGGLREHIAGIFAMHPAYFAVSSATPGTLEGIPTIMCWAKDDHIPFALTEYYIGAPTLELIAYESGRHHNFDGTDNLPNFDDSVLAWWKKYFDAATKDVGHLGRPSNTIDAPVPVSKEDELKDGYVQETATLIEALYEINMELEAPNGAPPKLAARDPHMRLRRTLTPSNSLGFLQNSMANFIIQDSNGTRVPLHFSWEGNDFQMDGYMYGADETDATYRIVALHGVTPGASRTRFHQLGERLSAANPGVRFCALDWHSIDRRDAMQDAFLTMLPGHFFHMPSDDVMSAMTGLTGDALAAAIEKMKPKFGGAPHSAYDGGAVLRAVITEGLGWGVSGKEFVLGIKSWSGAIGTSLLIEAAREGGEFQNSIAGAFMMHPGTMELEPIYDSLKNFPCLVCWARDDPKVSYALSDYYAAVPSVKLVTYEKGGHHAFDGTMDLPNFDDDVVAWWTREFAHHGSLIGADGMLQDDFVLSRVSINKKKTMTEVPQLVDLTTADSITSVDGKVLTQLIVSGFARLNAKVDVLNHINVFPIADNDTGANMKICLKLPTRNLLLEPSDSARIVASNMAADVLLNGQGNSGTILSHFFISLAEELAAVADECALSIDAFARCLARTGTKMNDAVSNPMEGTIVSVARDGCCVDDRSYASLRALLDAWMLKCSDALARTPDQLIVDGVKVLEKAGVVDSGAQGFVYIVEGMLMASKGELPEARDPSLFESRDVVGEDAAVGSYVDDHNVLDTKFQFCTEAVVHLKDGVDKAAVLECITTAADAGLGDSIACVGAPAKGGGNMVKMHIHTNSPETFFDHLETFSSTPLLRKEKVEDMFAERDEAQGKYHVDYSKAQFNVAASFASMQRDVCAENGGFLFKFPFFAVPETTQEPIMCHDCTFAETNNALNLQRHEETRIKYSTAASNPMQIKIQLLAALASGRSLLVMVISEDKRVSAMGRNIIAAVNLLTPEQKARVRTITHGWVLSEGLYCQEALRCAAEGRTIDETAAYITKLADKNSISTSIMSSVSTRFFQRLRPGLFPEDFTVKDGQYFTFGVDVKVRHGTPLTDMERASKMFLVQSQSNSLDEAHETEIQRIKDGLEERQGIGALNISCVGRPDYGYAFAAKLREKEVRILGKVSIFPADYAGVVMSSWGDLWMTYKIVDAETGECPLEQ